MKSAVKPKKKKAAAGRARLTVRNMDERLRMLVRRAESDRDNLDKLAREWALEREASVRRAVEATRKAEKDARKAEEDARKAEEDARKAEADRDRLARLEESLSKDRVNNENHRSNAARALEQEFAAALPRVMRREHNIRIHPRDVQLRVSRGRQRVEYDIVAPNGEVVLVCEVKSRLTFGDVLKMAGALRAFRRDYPEYAGLKLHGVVAGNIVEDDALALALEEGFFVLRMDGAEIHPATGKDYKPSEY